MKKFLLAVLVFALCVTGLALPVFAEEVDGIVVMFGDRFTTGYGLLGYSEGGKLPATHFMSLFLSDALEEDLTIDFYNYAKNDLTAAGLSEQIANLTEEQEERIIDAGFIAINIGTNDVMQAFWAALAKVKGVDTSNVTAFNQMKNEVSDAIIKRDEKAISDANKAIAACNEQAEGLAARFSESLEEAIKGIYYISEYNIIVIQNIPNFFSGVNGLHGMDEVLKHYNDAIDEVAEFFDLVVADINGAFEDDETVYFDMSSVANFINPYPDTNGHALIADMIYLAFDSQYSDDHDYYDDNIQLKKVPSDYDGINYADVNKKNWYYDAVTFFVYNDVLTPEAGERFNANDYLTMSFFLEFIEGLFETGDATEFMTDYGISFSDLNKTVERQNMFVHIDNLIYDYTWFFESNDPDTKRTLYDFTDHAQIKLTGEIVTSTEKLYQYDLIGGQNGLLNPTRKMTKAEMIQIMYNWCVRNYT